MTVFLLGERRISKVDLDKDVLFRSKLARPASESDRELISRVINRGMRK